MDEITYTLTFGNRAENHVGMDILGDDVPAGFTVDDLRLAGIRFEDVGMKIEHIDLVDYAPTDVNPERFVPARFLIVRDGLAALGVSASGFKDDMDALVWDTKALMKGKVVNKKARHNLCFSNFDREPSYAEGKGRIVSYDRCPSLAATRANLSTWFGPKAMNLVVEGNKYYDATCGIGFHGDTERKIVIGVRLGRSIPLDFQWYVQSGRVGRRLSVMLNDGDIYVMSEKAVGSDWKTRTEYTLRHAAGADSYRA